MSDLSTAREIYDELVRPTAPGCYSAMQIPWALPYRVAVNAGGRPCLLIDTESSSDIIKLPDTVGEHIEIRHGRQCEIIEKNGTRWSGAFTIVTCLSDDELLHGYFLDVADTLIHVLGTEPTESQLRHVIAGLMELFRALGVPARKAARGVWAELFVAASAREPVLVLRAWHPTYTEPFDFSEGAQRIEVKSSSDHTRRHHFKLEQLSPPTGTQVLVASVFVSPLARGCSIRDLAYELKNDASQELELQSRIDRVISEALGETLINSIDLQFDRELAADSLAFYPHDSIPAVREVPDEVSSVSFISDLTRCARISEQVMDTLGALFSAVRPSY